MSVADDIRNHTLAIRDAINGLDQRIEQAQAQRDAAEGRVTSVKTEITRQRTLETERKRSLNGTAEKVAEAQRTLDDIDRKRQEALKVLVRYQEEENAAGSNLGSSGI